MGNALAGVWSMRLLARVVLALVAASLALVAIAPLANAHPYLLFTTPGLDSAVAEAPDSIVLVFNQGLTVEPHGITITTLRGEPVPVAESRAFKAGTVLSAELPEKLAPGTYRVHWAAVGVDGHAVEDEFRFAVGAQLAGEAANSDEPFADWCAALRKWGLLIGFALAFGGVIAERFVVVARSENPTLPPVRQVSRYAAMLGLAAAATSAAVLVIDLGGVSALWQSRPGLAVTAEAAGFALAIALLTSSRPRWALAPLAVVALAEGAVSHGGVESTLTGAA
ncbi:MAG: copper resistance protein CopC, partial [Actinomycetia bacterium]|nr:copper resistance protein CopC [Actinomycetes bacterium]